MHLGAQGEMGRGAACAPRLQARVVGQESTYTMPSVLESPTLPHQAALPTKYSVGASRLHSQLLFETQIHPERAQKRAASGVHLFRRLLSLSWTRTSGLEGTDCLGERRGTVPGVARGRGAS